jgi:hypothetical protein
MSQPYTVYLFRSGRIWVQEGTHTPTTQDTDPPLLVEHAIAQTEYAAIGLVLLKYVDVTNQHTQHVCIPCEQQCCTEPCCCAAPRSMHNSGWPSADHTFERRP